MGDSIFSAPFFDRILYSFDHSNPNTVIPSLNLRNEMNKLFDEVRDLKPIKKNNEAKSIFITVPKGCIEDYGDYQDFLNSGDVTNYSEFEDMWKIDYPDDLYWYEVVLIENKYCRAFCINNNIIVCAAPEGDNEFENMNVFLDDTAIMLYKNILPLLKQSMQMLRDGKYNEYVRDNLPYRFKKGVVKRSIEWDADPESKEAIWQNMPADIFHKFEKYMESGENDIYKIKPISKMTGNDFLKACAIGYKACGYKGTDLPLVDQYLLHADGRDEGLTGKGDGLYSDSGIDLDSPEEWDKWYFDKNRHGGHPWEVCRGGNTTHVSLGVGCMHSTLKFHVLLGKISEEESSLLPEGYYFCVGGNAWTRAWETVRFYVALKEAGYPVILNDGDAILSRYRGTDNIGIVPHTIYPDYCSHLFPDKYGRILDFMHVYDKEMNAYGDKIEWLPEEPAVLLS